MHYEQASKGGEDACIVEMSVSRVRRGQNAAMEVAGVLRLCRLAVAGLVCH